MNKKEKVLYFIKINSMELLTIAVEGVIVTVSIFVMGKRKAKAVLFVGTCELVRQMVDKYFKKLNN